MSDLLTKNEFESCQWSLMNGQDDYMRAASPSRMRRSNSKLWNGSSTAALVPKVSREPEIWHSWLAISIPSEQAYKIIDLRNSPRITSRIILGMEVPRPLWLVANAVEHSRWMLELKNDWDGEGSPGYLEETWRRGVSFLLQNALSLRERFQLVIDTPKIHNGPEGSIDIYWNTPNGRLLINIPPESKGSASFYGCNLNGHEIKGTLSLNSDNNWLLLWQTGK